MPRQQGLQTWFWCRSLQLRGGSASLGCAALWFEGDEFLQEFLYGLAFRVLEVWGVGFSGLRL